MNVHPSPTAVRGRTALIVIIVIIALIALVVYLDRKQRANENNPNQPSQQAASQEQNRETAARVIAEVGKIYALPSGGEPTVASIVNVNALRQHNPFFNKAQNGDFLLVAGDRAILYSEKQNVILDIVPVQLTSSSSSSVAAPATAVSSAAKKK